MPFWKRERDRSSNETPAQPQTAPPDLPTSWLAPLDGVHDVSGNDREFIDVAGSITSDQLRAWVVAELATTGDPHYWDDRMI